MSYLTGHFENLENLGKPSTEPHYDEDFKEYIDGKVKIYTPKMCEFFIVY